MDLHTGCESHRTLLFSYICALFFFYLCTFLFLSLSAPGFYCGLSLLATSHVSSSASVCGDDFLLDSLLIQTSFHRDFAYCTVKCIVRAPISAVTPFFLTFFSSVVPPRFRVDPMPHDSPKPPGYTRFVCISDTHSRTDSIQMPYGDVFIHAGDFTELGLPSEVKKFNDWLG